MVAVAEPLLCPNESNAIGGRGGTTLVEPGTATGPRVGGPAETQVDGAAGQQRLGGICLVGVVRAVRRKFLPPPRGVVDVARGSEDLDDFPEVEDVPGLDITSKTEPADAKALGQPQVQVLVRRQPGAV